MDYIEIKRVIEAYSGLDKDALHLHAALLLYFVAMFVFRQTHRSRVPWLVVLAAEVANEIGDLIGHHRHLEEAGYEYLPFPWADSATDLWNTMLWPTAILVLGRYTTLFQRRPSTSDARAVGADDSSDHLESGSAAGSDG